MVSVEKLQETCLRSCRSLDAAERKFCYFAVDTLEVEHKVLQIEREAFSDSGELSRLEMSESKRGHCLVFIAEISELTDEQQKL